MASSVKARKTSRNGDRMPTPKGTTPRLPLPPTAHETPTPVFDAYITSWRRHLLAANLTTGTISIYTTEARVLCAYCANRARHDFPLDPRALTRVQMEAFFGDELLRRKAQTVKTAYVILGAFFKWLKIEGEIAESPLLHVKPP